jgi:energy-coupling factor transporter ATP-binding protein EcfA2
VLLPKQLIQEQLPYPQSLHEAAKSFEPKFSKELPIWDALTKMEDRWQRYTEMSQKESNCSLFKNRADIALENFQKSRDLVLNNIYDAIKCDFEAYYRELHSEDESNFVSKISPAGPELNFEVDFYGRGMFPPNALHSEGHQDSMGLCLFFALNKYLLKDIIEVIILDDVVMSIDSNHRRGICRLLKDYLSNRQFIITTHDAAWARQLRTEAIVRQENMVHFTNWNIETGPIYEIEKDLWDKIDECLTKDNVPTAAHLLRRNAELFFEDVCDLLGAHIRYRGDHQWELGDLAQAAISTYKRLLSRATVNAKKARQSANVKKLGELERKSSKIIAQSQIEQWIVNENVHYNKWKEYNKNDFEPVVEAFKQLFGLFTCPSCQNPIMLNEDIKRTPRASVSCKCGQIYWDVSN